MKAAYTRVNVGHSCIEEKKNVQELFLSFSYIRMWIPRRSESGRGSLLLCLPYEKGEIITKNIFMSLERRKGSTRVSYELWTVCTSEVSFKILACKSKKEGLRCSTKKDQKSLFWLCEIWRTVEPSEYVLIRLSAYPCWISRNACVTFSVWG